MHAVQLLVTLSFNNLMGPFLLYDDVMLPWLDISPYTSVSSTDDSSLQKITFLLLQFSWCCTASHSLLPSLQGLFKCSILDATVLNIIVHVDNSQAISFPITCQLCMNLCESIQKFFSNLKFYKLLSANHPIYDTSKV